MSVAIATNIINDDLLFGYDTGYNVADNDTGTRFYPGKPTTNLLSDTEAFNNWSFASNSGSHPTVTADTSDNPLGGSYTGMADRVYIPTGGTYPRIYKNFTPANTNVHKFSVWIRSISGTCGIFLGIFRNSPWSSPGSTSIGDSGITSEWQRFSFSFTPADTSSHQIYMGAHDAASHKGNTLEFWGAQIEEKLPENSPYTATSRSNTNSLIDLTRGANIDLTNVAFDSTVQPDLDGTDDYFKTSNLSIGTPISLTFEAVIRFNGTLDSNDRKVFHWDKTGSTNGVAQIRKGTNNGRLMYQHHNGTQWYTLSVDDVVVADTFAHIVVTHYDEAATMYKNSTQVGTGSVDLLNYTNAGEILIGYRTSAEYWKGNIPIFKVYSKILSASEIKQNYNSYKNRFGI